MTESKRQIWLYLVVGGWNTFFGMMVYWLFVWFFGGLGRFGYVIAAAVSNVIAVSESFLTYKLIVFRTRGHWLSEYAKCWAVYGGASLINLMLLPICVETVRWILLQEYKRYAPYIGGLVLTGVTVIISFIGHKFITFRRKSV